MVSAHSWPTSRDCESGGWGWGLQLYKTQRNSIDSSFQHIYEQVLRMAEKMGTEPCQPRTVKRQQHRSNIQVDAVFDHYKINIAIPFLDHVISDLYAQFSRKFAKRNFSHIGWISIYCYFNVYYRYIHLYSTVCYCCIATGSCTLRGLHPAG